MKFSLKRRRQMYSVYCRLSEDSFMMMEAAERAWMSGDYTKEEERLAKSMRIMATIHGRGIFKWYNRLWWY